MIRREAHELRGFGRVVTGSVLDCDKAQLERALKFYDRFLYIKWNTDKLDGRGCWEIRRAPEQLTRVYQGAWNGGRLYTLERKENDIINHVLDAPVLKWDLLGKIKSMDAWKHKDFEAHLANTAAEHEQRTRDKARAEMRYDIQQHKREWREFASLVNSGMNPHDVLKRMKG